MRLIQERYKEPWQILTACILLNRTPGDQVLPVLEQLFDEYSTRAELAAAPTRELERIIAPLGLGKRAAELTKMAHRIKDLPADGNRAQFVANLPGCGQYVTEAFRMLVDGERDFWPRDEKLRARMVELRLRPIVHRTHNSKMFLHLVTTNGTSIGLGIDRTQQIDIIKMSAEDFRRYTKPAPCEPTHLATKWLEGEVKYNIPVTDRAKELIMAIIGISKKGKIIGKFGTIEEAVQAAPAGSEVLNTGDDTEMNELSMADLVRVHNLLVGPEKQMAKFKDKATGVARVQAAADAYGVKAPKAPKEPKVPRAPKEPVDGEIKPFNKAVFGNREVRPDTKIGTLIELLMTPEGTTVEAAAAAMDTVSSDVIYRIKRNLPEYGYKVIRTGDVLRGVKVEVEA